MTPLLIFGIVLILIGVLVAATIAHNKKRNASIQALAPILKLRYSPKDDGSLSPLLSNFEFFAHGHGRVTNLLRGKIVRQGQPVEVAIFDYQYTVGTYSNNVSFDEDSVSVSSDSDTKSYCLTALVFYDESLNIPSFDLRPELMADKVANVFGFKDINFRDFPTFSKRYRLQSQYVDDVRELFQSNLIKFYESNQLRTEANGPYLLFFPFPTSMAVQNTYTIDGVTHMDSKFLSAPEIQTYLDLSWQAMELMARNTAKVTAYT
jgi:hypothetical protein